MNSRVRFEDEATEEYRRAGRWYEERRENLGVEFVDAVDDTIERILALPRSDTSVPRIGPDLPVRRLAVTRSPYHVVYPEMDHDVRSRDCARLVQPAPLPMLIRLPSQDHDG